MRRWLRVAGEFIWLESICCVFPFAVIGLLFLSHVVRVPGIPRYDALFVGCLAIQYLMLRWKLETVDEARTIALFHLIGLGLEIFKVCAGSWSYPDEGYLRVGGVPLFSGFMYASVGSYVCQAWKRFDLKMSTWPADWAVLLAATLVYGNFFWSHFWMDIRWPIIACIGVLFRRVWVHFTVAGHRYRMPLLLSFLLIGGFVWLAENVGTRLHAWQYPYQAGGWTHVDLGKLSSWSLLVIISVVLVAQLKRVKDSLVGPEAVGVEG